MSQLRQKSEARRDDPTGRLYSEVRKVLAELGKVYFGNRIWYYIATPIFSNKTEIAFSHTLHVMSNYITDILFNSEELYFQRLK